MTVRLSCLILTLTVASFGNGEDAPTTIGEVLNIPVTSGGPSTVKEAETSSIAPVELVQDKIGPNTPDIKKSGDKNELAGNDGYKRLVRNAGLGLKQPLGRNVPNLSSGSQSAMYPRYPLPYKRLNGLGQRRGFGPGQWNQGRFGPIGPLYPVRPNMGPDPLYPIRPNMGPVNQNPGGFWPVSERPMNNLVPFGGPANPQGFPPGAIERQNDFSGQGFQNGNRDDEDSFDFNIDLSFSDWDQLPVGWILADVNENAQGTLSAQIAMVVFPEIPGAGTYLPQNEGTRFQA